MFFKPFAKWTPKVTDDQSKDLQDGFELPQEEFTPRGGRCPMSENIQDQVRKTEEPAPVEDIPACCREFGLDDL